MRLSKSKIMSYRQCHKKLWLEVHEPTKANQEIGQNAIQFGNEVGEVARKIYDKAGTGKLIERTDINQALHDTLSLLSPLLSASPSTSPSPSPSNSWDEPIFEAGLATDNALAFIDVLLPQKNKSWEMIEVKAATQVKPYYIDDVSLQAFIAKSNGINAQVFLATVNSSWVYQGDGNYDGLLCKEDFTLKATQKEDDVQQWISQAHAIVKGKMPDIQTGAHCSAPYECAFYDFCKGQEEQAEYPVDWLPGAKKRELKAGIEQKNFIDIRDVPDELLNDKQKRVKDYTISGKLFFDKAAATNALAQYALPVYFLDFETISFAVPIWKGTRPYQQIPFQFSVHHLAQDNQLHHKEFLDLSGQNPSRACAEKLLVSCGDKGAIFVYNAGFEKPRISELAHSYPDLADELNAISARIIDLLPIARDYYYHPNQKGSWSLKNIQPTFSQNNDYAQLAVQDGAMAVESYREAIHSQTNHKRKQDIKHALLAYCKQDSEALVEIWRYFSNHA